jgi:hypothetical protein
MSDPRNGRPPKFTPEAREKILFAIRLGNYRKAAADYAGVGERTLSEWLTRGRDESAGPYADFLRDVLEAEQTAEIRALGVIQQAAKRDWKAAAWFLERKFPERYCTRAAVFLAQRLRIEGELDLDVASTDEIEAELLRSLRDVSATVPRHKLIEAVLEQDTRDEPGGSGRDD